MEVKPLSSQKQTTANRNFGLLWKVMFSRADKFEGANEFLRVSGILKS